MTGIHILYIVLPALLVLLTAYLLIHKMLKGEEKRRDFELRKNSLSVITPIRLRAYERLMLVLERTTPSTLVVNTIKPDMTCLQLQSQLVSTIRQEFGHNVSQQIYVSNQLWELIRGSQESLMRLINGCAAQCNPADQAAHLAELIIQVYAKSEQTPSEMAINQLKNEVRQFL
jgi:hypothetical protein